MANPHHLKKLKLGVQIWNQWREKYPDLQPDLQKACLVKADLREADLYGANLQEADLTGAKLQKAIFNKASLQKACLVEADLQEADLCGANLQEADLTKAKLQRADLSEAELRKAILEGAQLQQANLCQAHLHGAYLNTADIEDAKLVEANLQDAKLNSANLQKANLTLANLQGANLTLANLQRTILSEANLEGTRLSEADLRKANLSKANLRGANLTLAQLQGADLRVVHLEGTNLENVNLSDEEHGSALLADISWDDVNLAVIDWTTVEMLGDEHEAHDNPSIGKYQAAVRANQQLAAVLQNQGLNAHADRFAYHAQVCNHHQLGLKIRENLAERPKLGRLVVKPSPPTSSLNLLQNLIVGGLAVCLALIPLFWWAPTLGKGVVLLPSIVGIFLALSLLIYYQPFVRLILASLLIPLLTLGPALGLLLLVFYFLLNLLLHPAWLLLLLFFALFLALAATFRVPISEALWKRIKPHTQRIHLLSLPYIELLEGFGRYLFSGFLYLVAGYGYRPMRTLIWYFVIIFGFATAYNVFGHLSLFPPDALVYSLTSFHGRGFFPGLENQASLQDPSAMLHHPLVILAALEAVVGLFIEISFIATFTQRFFGK